ncbi:hypothetical protein TNCV_345251 [Trichonephila clavipes]|nr:hypothetical protein TNCV_345251 [Trichonephila clavipes]
MECRTRRITQEIPGKRLENTRRTGKLQRVETSAQQESRGRQRHPLVSPTGRDIRKRSSNSRLVQGHQMWG